MYIDQISSVFSTILPIFGLIFLGYVASRFAWMPAGSAKPLNHFVFYFALPAILFLGVAEAPARALLNYNFIFANLGAAVICFVIAVAVAFFIFKIPYRSIPLRGMVSCYGNTGYMGIPLIVIAFGPTMLFSAVYGNLLHSVPLIILVMLMFEIPAAVQKG